MAVFPFVGAFWVELLEGREVVFRVVFVGVYFGDWGVGREAFGADSEAVYIGGHLSMLVALGGGAWFGWSGGGAGVVYRVCFEVEFFDLALSEHAYLSADEWLYVFVGVGRLG